jgi:hypothetical protein
MAQNFLMRPIEDRDQREHFMTKVSIINGHWMWNTGLNSKNGYGVLYIGAQSGKRRFVLAHRRAYELFIGPIPKGEWVLHTEECNIRQCCNPQHLKLGSPKQNSKDCFTFGSRGRSHLTDVDILNIQTSNRPRKDLALEYNLCYHTIMRIQNGKTWKSV